MPFTPSHILAIVPVGKLWPRKLAFSALAIGSIVPDWPLFIPIGPSYSATHSLIGLAIACIPLGLAIYVFFHSVLKQPLFELLPHPLRQRSIQLAAPTVPSRMQQWLDIIIAIAIGALTHIVWDAFSHQGKWGTQLIPVLNRTVLTIGNQPIPGYKLVQYGSSAIGLPLLLVFLLMWLRTSHPRATPPSPLTATTRTAIIASLLVIPTLAGFWPIAQLLSSPMSYETFTDAIVSGVILAGGVLLVAIGIYSLLFYPLVRLQKK
ncbi:MAG: DUF4184 family protein [Cyanobacteria bacterium P01_G01_bin.4]